MNTFYKVMALSAIAFCSFSTQAENSLRLQDAIRFTLQNNPQLTSYEFRVKALQGEQQTAELKPQLRAAAHVENIAGTGEFNGVDAGEFTLSLSSVIELGDQRAARTGLVTARQQQLESNQRVLTLDLLTQATQQFIALAAAQEKLTLLQQSQQLAQENANALNKQVQAGHKPEAELLRAKASVARANIATQKMRQAVNGERIKLNAFWVSSTSTITAPTFTQVEANLLMLPPLAPLPSLIEKLEMNPDLAVMSDEIQLRAAELRKAQAERDTNLEWNAGVRRLQISNDSALVFGLSMPLGSVNRASGAIATAHANQSEAEQERNAARIKLHAQLISLHGDYQQALVEVNTLQTAVLPALKQAIRATADAFNQGRYSYLELNLAQSELLDAQLALIDAATHAHLVNSEIERLTGAVFPLNSDAKIQP